MEMKQIKELMAAMEKAGLKRLRIKDKNNFEIEMEKPEDLTFHAAHHLPPPKFPAHATPPYRGHHPEEPPKAVEKPQDGKFITAPLVGTLYYSPSPDDPPFIKVGDRVDENTVVCIIEAMKVMNEVKANISGVVAEVLVENAHPVEFGSKLFRIV
jgi:acetyl-CoA carboxylase biotin carboxyl carrier protein